ncbi:hypothetical protein Tco_0442521 [Tanacetum coccineum]
MFLVKSTRTLAVDNKNKSHPSPNTAPTEKVVVEVAGVGGRWVDPGDRDVGDGDVWPVASRGVDLDGIVRLTAGDGRKPTGGAAG